MDRMSKKLILFSSSIAALSNEKQSKQEDCRTSLFSCLPNENTYWINVTLSLSSTCKICVIWRLQKWIITYGYPTMSRLILTNNRLFGCIFINRFDIMLILYIKLRSIFKHYISYKYFILQLIITIPKLIQISKNRYQIILHGPNIMQNGYPICRKFFVLACLVFLHKCEYKNRCKMF